LTSANFSSLSENYNNFCQTSKNSFLNCQLNSIFLNREREMRNLEAEKQSAIDRAGFLQNLKAEEKAKNPNSGAEWAEKIDQAQFLKNKLEEVELEWDQHFLMSIFSGLAMMTPTTTTKGTGNNKSQERLFPLQDSIDFEIPNDPKILKILQKNVLPTTATRMTSKESELEISVSFLRAKLFVTKRIDEEEQDSFEDIHINELKIVTTKILGNEI
jgi:hypothetical protein